MADYRLRGHRRYPNKPMRQVVIYLRPSKSPLVYQDTFNLENSFHRFQVLRIWEQPTETFLGAPGLLPFAVLSQTADPVATLQQVSQRLQALSPGDPLPENLTASTTILAGLLLDQELIQSILRRDVMRESSVYQAILAEGRQEGLMEGIKEGIKEGLAQGLAQGLTQGLTQGISQGINEGLNQGISQGISQGRTEEAQKLVLRLLRLRLELVPSGTLGVDPDRVMSRELELRLEQLSLVQWEALGEALLAFEKLEDLLAWLAAQKETGV
ncbi:MAG: hypothetical protein RLZZ435_2289 [Cyanobacteriota bacterium]|jgi:hypothetical protein